MLTAALADARHGRPGMVVIGGDAGVGKTRLMAESVAGAEATGDLVLAGGCVDLGEGILPFGPITEALRDLPRRLDPAALSEVVGPGRDELGRLVPELGGGDGVAQGHSPGRLFELLLGVFRRLTAVAPVVLVLEDLHWADQSTRDLLTFLVRNVRGERLLIIVTFRTDELHRRHPLRPFLA